MAAVDTNGGRSRSRQCCVCVCARVHGVTNSIARIGPSVHHRHPGRPATTAGLPSFTVTPSSLSRGRSRSPTLPLRDAFGGRADRQLLPSACRAAERGADVQESFTHSRVGGRRGPFGFGAVTGGAAVDIRAQVSG